MLRASRVSLLKISSQPILLLFKFFILIQFLKVAFYLQLLQSISYIPRVVQYMVESVLQPVV